jgi:hypothetical protein
MNFLMKKFLKSRMKGVPEEQVDPVRNALESISTLHKSVSPNPQSQTSVRVSNGVDMILDMMEKNPELFKKIAEEIKERVDKGEDQATVSMEVMKKYEAELKALNS